VIAVTGATGELGGRVARGLAERGVAQRLIVRDASRAPSLEGAELAIAASYRDRDGMEQALKGCDTVFLVSAREAADRMADHRAAVEAAVAAGVGRIVYTSFLAAAPDATFTFARDHFQTERLIRETGLPFDFLRSSLYADYLPLLVGEDDVIRGPGGDGRVAPVARDDVAAVALALLAGAAGDTAHDVTGPEAMTLEEAAATLAEATGRPIRYQRETLDEARASRAASGAEPWEIEGWITSYAAIATGELDIVSDTVERKTGRRAVSLAELLERAGRE
jgi:NAD(P)H dehydrogenase (quinone)